MKRQRLCQCLTAFFVVNTFITSLIVIVYFPNMRSLLQIPEATKGVDLFAIIYFLLAFLAQVSLLMLLSLVICRLLARFFQSYRMGFVLAAFFVTVILLFFAIDALLYTRIYHMHYAALALRIYRADAFSQVLPLNRQEWLLIIAGFLGLFSLLLWFAHWLSRYVFKTRQLLIIFFVANWIFVYGSLSLAMNEKFWSSPYQIAVLRAARIAPYLSQVYRQFFVPKPLLELNYPHHPLEWKANANPLNILIIAIDTWRYSAISSQFSPHIQQLAQQSIQFKQHYSGGNCTQSGLFSLFYGIPATYWDSFVSKRQSPLLFDVLKQQHYQLGIFPSATPKFPEFDDSVFSAVSSSEWQGVGKNSLERDQHVTNKLVDFIEHHDTHRPFFGFIFYDALHNYCETAMPVQTPARPYIKQCNRFFLGRRTDVLPYLNRYNNKLYDIDQKIGKIFQALSRQDLWRNTIIILTADHGEQMNDEGRGLWGHASAYNDYQLRVPLIIYWPDRSPAVVNHRTTHYDIPATLLSEVLGVTNPVNDYAVGHHLFSAQATRAFIAASYGDYAMIVPPQALRIYPDGDYQWVDF